MIDATEIVPLLFQGSIPPEGYKLRDAGFDVLVLCADEHQPHAERFHGIEVIHAPNDDSGRPPTIEELGIAKGAARKVAAHLASGKRVLVTCAAGRNRSGLVSALALHFRTGRSGAACARVVRRMRANALMNDYFVRFLERIPPRDVLGRVITK